MAEVSYQNGREKLKRAPLDYTKLLQNVPSPILAKILQIFHLDFVLFGYDKEPFLKILREKEKGGQVEAKQQDQVV